MYLCSKLVSNYRLYKGMRIVIQLKNICVYDITFHNIQYNYRYYSWILKHVIYTVILWVMSFNVLMYTFYGFYVACTCMISWWLLYYMCTCSKLSFYFMHPIVTDVVFSDMSVAGCSKGGLENTVWCVRGCHHSRTHRHGFLSNWAHQVQGVSKASDKIWSKICYIVLCIFE